MGVGVGLGIGVGVGVGVGVGMGVGVGVGVDVGTRVGVEVDSGVGTGIGAGMGVGVARGVGAGTGMGVKVGAGIDVGVDKGVWAGVGVGTARVGIVTVGVGGGDVGVEGSPLQAVRAPRITANATNSVSARRRRAFMSNMPCIPLTLQDSYSLGKHASAVSFLVSKDGVQLGTKYRAFSRSPSPDSRLLHSPASSSRLPRFARPSSRRV